MSTTEQLPASVQTETLRLEHEQLLDHVEEIRIAALELPVLAPEERRLLIDRIVWFLEGPFEAYAESEARALFPYLSRVLHDPHATERMQYDADAVRRFIDRLRETDLHNTPKLQELLYGVHAIITVHLRKEDDLYLPLLERQRPEQVEHVLRAMHEVRFGHDHPARGDL
jgi:Hemerythrin HHE cation binding domain